MKTIHILTLGLHFSLFFRPNLRRPMPHRWRKGRKIYETTAPPATVKKAKAEEQCSRPCSVPTTS